MADSSARELIEHWVWATEKGLLNASTGKALATACRGVLEVQEDWENLNISSIDIEDSFNRFKNLRSRDFTPRSLSTYASRFRRAVLSYRSYLEDPASWRYETRTASGKRSIPSDRPKKSQRKHFPNADLQTDGGRTKEAIGHGVAVDSLQEYLYPLRPDALARLSIPRDANTAEINRLVAWARTLATDYEPSS